MIVALQIILLYNEEILEPHPMRNMALLFITAVNAGVILLLLVTQLETSISETGITYRFFPFHIKQKTIQGSTIDKAFVRKYKPLMEYGGWGFRLGIFGHGRALNISGNMGLQLVFKNGKRLLLGTKKPGEIEKVLSKISLQ